MSIRIIVEVSVVVWLAVCAGYDLCRREAPNWLTLPAVALALVYRLLTPEGWLPWALVVATIVLTLAGVLPGGDMKGLAAMALLDPRLYLLAWLGAGMVYVVWRIVRGERRMPGYVGFAVGAVGWWLARLTLF
ncbi:prepilin peptidase [Thermanaerothrix sp.]|jgi:prepilin peptidase CpaA|uniref:prepilin peptidase n=1 Tax=Thermanaerothrix sp. TaxID=2972675 RepID=UPI002ADE422B|nr:prepilin peptidase [Thermanaerothrix sp.]